jgi:glycosyltransferase involved in cell wall biosynthesis
MMRVVKATSGDFTVNSPSDALFKVGTLIRPQVASLARHFLKAQHRDPLSSAILPSRWPALVNMSDADIVHLHWLNAEMMSVEDVGRIEKPVVWTLHDMWAFCGAEHCPADGRWREGYMSTNRRSNESGFDLNRWVWNRKRRAWKKPLQIVTPSNWLANCVRESALMEEWPVTSIPNPIDTDVWKPIDRKLAREFFRLKQDAQFIAFGAFGSEQASHKGYDLLLAALDHLRGQMPHLEVLIFGMACPKELPDLGFTLHYSGHLHDDLSLRVLYSAADAVIIPSRIDNLPNIGVEAMACGTPVVAFDTCGLPDIVTHQQTGWLAKAFDAEELARGIQWVLADENRHSQLCLASRESAVQRYAYPVVAAQYKDLYEQVLGC